MILDFAELKPWEKEQRLAEWVNKQASASRKLIAYPVCQFLVKRMGPDQALLAKEIEKLICYAGRERKLLGKMWKRFATGSRLNRSGSWEKLLFRGMRLLPSTLCILF